MAASKKIAALDLRRPMRFTGQAFYDASHKPCDPDGMPHGSSHRISSWEIHPVYAIEVCVNTSKAGCPLGKPERWKPLHEWLAAEARRSPQPTSSCSVRGTISKDEIRSSEDSLIPGCLWRTTSGLSNR